MAATGYAAYGDDEFGRLRALAASQRHGAELLARAELTAKEIEARAEATVEAILMGPGPGELAMAEMAAQVEAILRREREALEASLSRLHEQFAAGAHRVPVAVQDPPGAVQP